MCFLAVNGWILFLLSFEYFGQCRGLRNYEVGDMTTRKCALNRDDILPSRM
jgi:hypothetical protein